MTCITKIISIFATRREGQAAGSTAIKYGFAFPVNLSFIKSEIKPPKLEPPPAQPIIISGYSSTFFHL